MYTNTSQAVVHMHEKPKSMRNGRKRAFSVIEDSEGDPDDLTDKETLEILNDPSAQADDDSEYRDEDSDIDMNVAVRSMTQMSVDVCDKQTNKKRIKLEGTKRAVSINSKKPKPNNAHIPEGIGKSWRATFLPVLMYWVGNSSYCWTIPEDDLCNALYEISDCIGSKNRVLHEFEVGTYSHDLVSFL